MDKRTKREWYVRVKGEARRGPHTHADARSMALEIVKSTGEAPTMHRVVSGKTVSTFTPKFPQLRGA